VAEVFRSPIGACAVTIGSMALSRSLTLRLVIFQFLPFPSGVHGA
jgi:hypothetical protein